MNNKENRLRGLFEREREFCDLLVLVGNGSDVGTVTFFLPKELKGATFSTSWFFELLPEKI